MNNKGFAVTTLIYGLSIMGIMIVMVILGTISVSRRNIRDISKQVEQDLLNYGKVNVLYKATGPGPGTSEYVYSIPEGESGFYRIEAWGAGHSGDGGGKGAYTTGIVFLSQGDKLSLNPGYDIDNDKRNTTISVRDEDGNKSEIMIAAGAFDDGVDGGIDGGTLCPYKKSTFNPDVGELNENFDIDNNRRHFNGSMFYSISLVGNTTCTFIDDDRASTKGNYSKISGYNFSGSDKVFIDTLMLPGVNGEKAGMISIKKISSSNSFFDIKQHMNEKYKNVEKIKVSYDSVVDVAQSSCYLKLSYIGYDYNEGREVFREYSENIQPINNKVDFEKELAAINLPESDPLVPPYHITDISFICDTGDSSNFIGNNVNIKFNDNVDIYDGLYMFPSPTGIKLSAFQPDSTDNETIFPDHGNYYILPVNSENRVVNGPDSDSSDSVNYSYLTGSNNQKWNIDKIDKDRSYFKIINLGTYRALNVRYMEKILGHELTTDSPYNMLNPRDDQQWVIRGNRDNTFYLRTITNGSNDIDGYILADTRKASDGGTGNLLIGPGSGGNPSLVERFRFYSLDFIK